MIQQKHLDLIEKYCALTGASFDSVMEEAVADYVEATLSARLEHLQVADNRTVDRRTVAFPN